MEHAFTTESGYAGVWTTVGNQVYCRWQFDDRTRNLVVQAGEVTRSWITPEFDPSGESGIQVDLPETARDIARLIERETRAVS